MKKIIAILVLLIVLLTGVLLMYGNLVGEKEPKNENVETQQPVVHSEKYNEIVSKDYINNYPPGYLEVIEENNEIVLYQYGTEIVDSEAQDIIEVQRELFATELLELNPLETQVAGYISEVNENRNREVPRYMTDRKIVTSEVIAYDGSIVSVYVDEYYSDGMVVQYDYYLISEGGKWKIYSIERFVVKVSDATAAQQAEEAAAAEEEAKKQAEKEAEKEAKKQK